MLNIIQIPVLTDNYVYLLNDPVSGATAAVDPALAAPVLDCLQQKGWSLTYVFNTHHHHDHVGGNLELKQKTGCTIVAGFNDVDRIPGIDIGVTERDTLLLGEQRIAIIDTPGHTNGHIAYYVADDGLLFCGDTLFSMGCGRLFEGSAEQLWHSLQKFKALPETTRIYCAHEYTLSNSRFAYSVEPDNVALQQRMLDVAALRDRNLPTIPSTLAQELATNPFLREDSLEIKTRLDMTSATPSGVFARLRALKDVF